MLFCIKTIEYFVCKFSRTNIGYNRIEWAPNMVEILSKQTIETSTANTLFFSFSLRLYEDLYDSCGSAIIKGNKDLNKAKHVIIMKMSKNNPLLDESNVGYNNI